MPGQSQLAERGVLRIASHQKAEAGINESLLQTQRVELRQEVNATCTMKGTLLQVKSVR